MGGKIGMGGKIRMGGKSEWAEWAELRAEKSEWAEFADFWIMVSLVAGDLLLCLVFVLTGKARAWRKSGLTVTSLSQAGAL